MGALNYAGAGDPCSGAAADGPGHAAHPPPGPRTPSRSKGQRACALDPENKDRTAAAVHLQRRGLCGPQHGGPPMADYTLQDAMELVLDAPGIDGVVIDPWGHSATLDEALLNGLLHAGHNPEEPGDEEVEAGREAARAGTGAWRPTTTTKPPSRAMPWVSRCWPTACTGAGARCRTRPRPAGCGAPPPTTARCWPCCRWARTALPGRSGQGPAVLPQSPADGAGHAGHRVYPRICLRLAGRDPLRLGQKAMALAAEAAQGFAILAGEGTGCGRIAGRSGTAAAGTDRSEAPEYGLQHRFFTIGLKMVTGIG